MINDPSRIQLRDSENALTVLEHFSVAAGVAFDRIVASRVLVETEQSVSGLDGSAWSRRLVQVGESINLRIRSVECRFSESLAFVRHGVPVAICLSDDQEAEGDNQNGAGADTEKLGPDPDDEAPHWVIIAEVNGSRFRVIELGAEQSEHWMSSRQLRKLLNIQSPNQMGRWLIGQAALWCETPASEDKGKPAKPLTRLLGLLRPEKKDLWVVVVFSIIVGFLALASPVAVEALVNTVAFGQYLQPVVILALMLFTFLAFASAIRALLTFVVEIFQRRLFIRVVEDLAYRFAPCATSTV